MVRLILFDIDGTLVNTGHAGTRAFAKTFATEFDLHHGSEKMKFAGRTDVSLVREFFRIHGLDESPGHFGSFSIVMSSGWITFLRTAPATRARASTI
jgi:phosphoglycolate phosphatase-like HAD superfamily hydrolase